VIPGPVTRFLLVGATVVLTVSGCATLTVVPPERLADQRLTPGAAPVAHIYAANWGVYLFKHLPLVTGSLARPGVPRFPALFSDQVRIDSLVEKVSEQSKQLGGTVLTDLRTRDRSYYMYWSLFFWLNEFEVSANASRAP
jgi:hypothetical protein